MRTKITGTDAKCKDINKMISRKLLTMPTEDIYITWNATGRLTNRLNELDATTIEFIIASQKANQSLLVLLLHHPEVFSDAQTEMLVKSASADKIKIMCGCVSNLSRSSGSNSADDIMLTAKKRLRKCMIDNWEYLKSRQDDEMKTDSDWLRFAAEHAPTKKDRDVYRCLEILQSRYDYEELNKMRPDVIKEVVLTLSLQQLSKLIEREEYISNDWKDILRSSWSVLEEKMDTDKFRNDGYSFSELKRWMLDNVDGVFEKYKDDKQWKRQILSSSRCTKEIALHMINSMTPEELDDDAAYVMRVAIKHKFKFVEAK